jgi:transcriptional regulator with XRE-family HTH domain
MSGYLLAFLTIVGGLFAAAVGDMVSEEVRDRLDHVPHAILKLAASRLDAPHRAAIYDDEWLPELTYILQGDEARPVSRVYHGTRYALGILIAARRIARDLHRSAPLAESQPRPFQTAVRAEQPESDDRQDLKEPAAEATVLRMLLGAQLRRLREAVGITAEEAGYEIRASRSKISRMETGRVGFKLRDIEDLLTLYGVLDERQRAKVIALAARSREPEWWTQHNDILPDWFETYLGLESAAVAIRSFETQFVPGLFQTKDYARAVTTLGHRALPDGEIERRVWLRLRRQDLLARREPPRVWAVIDEAVLRRPVGGAAVMRGQLARLDELDLPGSHPRDEGAGAPWGRLEPVPARRLVLSSLASHVHLVFREDHAGGHPGGGERSHPVGTTLLELQRRSPERGRHPALRLPDPYLARWVGQRPVPALPEPQREHPG